MRWIMPSTYQNRGSFLYHHRIWKKFYPLRKSIHMLSRSFCMIIRMPMVWVQQESQYLFLKSLRLTQNQMILNVNHKIWRKMLPLYYAHQAQRAFQKVFNWLNSIFSLQAFNFSKTNRKIWQMKKKDKW